MELAVWGAEVAAVHAPPRERAARSTAPWARKPPKPSEAEREQAKRAASGSSPRSAISRSEWLPLALLTAPCMA